MVTSITPGATGAAALGVDQRYARPAPLNARAPDQGAQSDRVELGDAASWSAARESVRTGLAQVHQALAIGHDAQAMLLQARELVSGDDPDAQAKLEDLLSGFAERIESAIGQGARLVSGSSLSVQAEPGSASVVVPGVDLTLKADPGEDDVLQVAAGAQVEDSGLAQAVQTSLERLQDAMQRLLDAARSLEAHQGFLGAAEGAASAGVRTDLDADAARLLALQVRQGLDNAGGRAIANVEPQAVLSLFRA